MPDGEIKDFIEGFYFLRAFENINNGVIYSFNEEYINDELVGTHNTYYEFEKKDDKYYYYVKRDFTGTLIDEDSKIETFEQLSYIDKNNDIYCVSITNGIRKEVTNINKTNLFDEICKVFYADKSYDYYRGGLYYGDLLQKTAIKYYMNLSIKNDLLYYTLKNDITYEGVIFNQEFAVDTYGMINTYHYDAEIMESNDKVVNDIKAIYNTEIDYKSVI